MIRRPPRSTSNNTLLPDTTIFRARDRTTPDGRFVGGYGPSSDAGRVLWVDYDSAVSIHPTATGVPAERRVERLASPSPDDNRITHGCINVSPEFYEQVVSPTFERSEEHTSELQSLMRTSYAVFCLKKKKHYK